MNIDGGERVCVNTYVSIPKFKRTSINAVKFCRLFFVLELCKRSLILLSGRLIQFLRQMNFLYEEWTDDMTFGCIMKIIMTHSAVLAN